MASTQLPSLAAASQDALSVRVQKRLGAFMLDVDFSLPAGITIIFGASGAGKTTLLDSIAGIVSPDLGRIFAGGRVLVEESIRIPPQKRNVGYVFQELALFPHMTAEQNVEYGLAGFDQQERQRRSGAILDSFRVLGLKNRKPAEISGGERQRVALARALVTDPCVLLLDEPLAALDVTTKNDIVDDLREWNRAHTIPILYVTHSRDEVFALGERVMVLENGKVLAQGTPHEVLTAPREQTIAQLAGFENIFDVDVIATHENRGTMTCRIAGSGVELEAPLVRADAGAKLRVGIRAGDILLATAHPKGLSARNVLPGRVLSLEQRGVIAVTLVDCGAVMEVHLTLAARDDLALAAGREVWLVIKTYSCHLMA